MNSALPPTPDVRYGAWLTLGTAILPDSTIPVEQKGEQYCNDKARYYASQVSGLHVNWFRVQYATNAMFSRGEWGEEEDRLLFLKDGKRSTTRKELSIPIAHPMVMRHVGTAASISISAKAEPVTQHATTKREQWKNRALAMKRQAEQGPYVANAIQQNTGFGAQATDEEVIEQAGKTYPDEFARAVNSIMTMQEKNNDYEFLKNSNANLIACSGLFSTRCYKSGTRLKWEWVHPLDVAWGATNQADFRNCQYMIHNPLMNTGEIIERWPVKKDLIKAIESQASAFGAGNDASGAYPQGMPRVMTVYWREPVWVKMGYVLIDGVPYLAPIDEKDPQTGEIKYTENDCIEPPNIPETRDWKGKTSNGFMEQVWFCTFIPWEYTPFANASGQNQTRKAGDEGCKDVILDYGPYDLQEVAFEDPFKVRFPIKLSAVELIDGYVVAPLTFTISPQRIMNQVASQLTWQMSKARPTSTWVNPGAFTDTMSDVKDIDAAIKEGNTFEMDPVHVGGAANAVGTLAGGFDEGSYRMWGVIGQLQQVAQQATGIYDSTQGKASNAGQLVGTTELLLQQSNAMMQSFTQCIINGFKQMHQFDAQAGKSFYQQYPWALEEMVGDEGISALMMSPDMSVEQFRVAIEPSVNSEQLKAATDQMILQFMQLGLLDKVTAANLGGRSYPSDVWAGAREFSLQEVEAAKAQMQAQAQAAQAAALAGQAQQLQEEKKDAYGRAFDLMAEKMKLDQKTFQPTAQRVAEATIPVPSEQGQQAATPGT